MIESISIRKATKEEMRRNFDRHNRRMIRSVLRAWGISAGRVHRAETELGFPYTWVSRGMYYMTRASAAQELF